MGRHRLTRQIRDAAVLACAAFLAGCTPGTEQQAPTGSTNKGAGTEAASTTSPSPTDKTAGAPVATSSGRRRQLTDAETAQRIAELRFVGERFVAGVVVRPAEIAQTETGRALLAAAASGSLELPGAELFAPFEPRTGLKAEEIDILVRLTDIEQLKAFALRGVPSTAAGGATRPEVPPEVVAASIEQKRREHRRVCQPTIVVVSKQPVDREAFAKRLTGFRERVVHDQAFWESEDGECIAVPEDRVIVLGRKEALLDSLLGRETSSRLRLMLAKTGRHHVTCGVDVQTLDEARMYDPVLHTLPSSLLAAATFVEPARAAVATLDLDGPRLLRIHLRDLRTEAAGTVFEQIQNLLLKARADYGQLATADRDGLPPFLRAFGPIVTETLASAAVDRDGQDVEVIVSMPAAWSRVPRAIEQWTADMQTAAGNPPAAVAPPAAVTPSPPGDSK